VIKILPAEGILTILTAKSAVDYRNTIIIIIIIIIITTII
jgi:hypothetical protein